jgi:hypothetical protein
MAVHNFLFGKRSNVALIADFFALIAAASAGLKKEGKSSSGCAQEFRLCLLQGATKLCNSFLSLLEMTNFENRVGEVTLLSANVLWGDG